METSCTSSVVTMLLGELDVDVRAVANEPALAGLDAREHRLAGETSVREKRDGAGRKRLLRIVLDAAPRCGPRRRAREERDPPRRDRLPAKGGRAPSRAPRRSTAAAASIGRARPPPCPPPRRPSPRLPSASTVLPSSPPSAPDPVPAPCPIVPTLPSPMPSPRPPPPSRSPTNPIRPPRKNRRSPRSTRRRAGLARELRDGGERLRGRHQLPARITRRREREEEGVRPAIDELDLDLLPILVRVVVHERPALQDAALGLRDRAPCDSEERHTGASAT